MSWVLLETFIFDYMKRLTFFTALFLLFSVALSAQIAAPSTNTPEKKEVREGGFDRHNLFTGGNFGLQLGQSTYFELSPNIGYKVSERFRPGVGLNYQYWRQKDQTAGNVSQSIVGWRAFGSYTILENIIGYGEYENLRIKFQNQNVYVSNVWAGLGYRQWLGENSAIDMMVLYNTMYNEGSQGIRPALYGSPWNLKMGVIIGL